MVVHAGVCVHAFIRGHCYMAKLQTQMASVIKWHRLLHVLLKLLAAAVAAATAWVSCINARKMLDLENWLLWGILVAVQACHEKHDSG